MSDDDAHDTRVLPREDTPIDFDGTAEVDRAALLAAISGDRAPAFAPKPLSRQRDTEQNVAISDRTMPVDARVPKHDATQHYQVPQNLIDQARQEFQTIELEPLRDFDDDEDEDDDLPTATFSMESVLEFDAVVDEQGRLALPASALKGRFAPGARLKVIARIDED